MHFLSIQKEGRSNNTIGAPFYLFIYLLFVCLFIFVDLFIFPVGILIPALCRTLDKNTADLVYTSMLGLTCMHFETGFKGN